MYFLDLPRFSLGFLPTPLHKLKALSSYLSGPSIFIKRDDLTGLAFGGNKTRKLEFLIGNAVAQGCDTVITGGAIQSNHCRQTAAAAAAANLDCHLVIAGEDISHPTGNLLLDILLGAIIHWSGKFRKGELIPEVADSLKSTGRKPYLIPYGGSDRTGALGYVDAVGELVGQAELYNLNFSHVVFASSSGGTQAGVLAGKNLFRQNFDVIGVQIDKEPVEGLPLEDKINEIFSGLADMPGASKRWEPGNIILVKSYCNEGYGVVGKAEKEAIQLLATLEGIFLDPVYTARAMAALIDKIRKKEFDKDDTILFWHTGGTPSLFAYSEELSGIQNLTMIP